MRAIRKTTRVRRKTHAPTETQLQISVFSFLNAALLPGWFPFHVPNGGLRSKLEAARLKKMGVRAGFPDIGIIGRGRVYLIELKREGAEGVAKGRLSPVQKEIHPLLAAAGAAVAVCYTIEEVQHALDVWGIPLRAKLDGDRVIHALRDAFAFDVVTTEPAGRK